GWSSCRVTPIADHTYRIIACLPEFDLPAAISSAPIAQAVRTQIPGVKTLFGCGDLIKAFFRLATVCSRKKGSFLQTQHSSTCFPFPWLPEIQKPRSVTPMG